MSRQAAVSLVRRPPPSALLCADGACGRWAPEAGGAPAALIARWHHTAVAFRVQDSSQLLAGYPQGLARLCGDSSQTLRARCGSVLAAAFSACGAYCITGSENCTGRVWSVATGSCVKTLCRHSGAVLAVGLSSNVDYAVTGGSDELAKLWDVKTGKCVLWALDTGSCSQTIEGSDAVRSVAISRDGDQLLSGDVACSKIVQSKAAGARAVTGVRGIPNGAMPAATTAMSEYYRHDGVRITHDPYAPGMAEKYGLPGKTDNEGFDPYADTVGPGIYGGIVKRDTSGQVLIGRQYQNHNPRPGPIYAGGGYTPINEALRKGTAALKPLLDKYPDLANDISTGGATPLHMCGMGRDNQHATEYLIKTSRHSCSSAQRGWLQFAFSRIRQVEALDTYGMTPLHRMASNNLPVGARTLLEAKADPSNRGQARLPNVLRRMLCFGRPLKFAFTFPCSAESAGW
ncbi:unnamed protein product [Effrenium voratum]|uniref:Uncharacterized protein n=1 Tax=Effrenium voratum TaxID=2562239 RepID=A0AA36MTP6_9DINO|nr:unnamed protein product [Effrenium voratum]